MTRSIHSARYAELRRLLVEARTRAGLTQQQVGDRLGRPQSYVSKLEHGDRRLDVVEFLELVEAIGADGAEIVRRLSRAGEKGRRVGGKAD